MSDECPTEQVTIIRKLDLVGLKLDELKDTQQEMAEDISKVKEAIFHPDQGLYARLRELESWKASASKVIWILVTSMVGVMSYIIQNALFSK
jgi:hypothetical protein